MATTKDHHSIYEILLGLTPYPMTLAIMTIEAPSRFVEFIRADPPQFNGDPRFDAHEFLVVCNERLH